MTDHDVTGLRARIPEYAGLADPLSRRASDQHLRAWAGEQLAGLGERVERGAGPRDRINDAVLRCELGDQHLIVAFEAGGALEEPAARAQLAAADKALVAAVDAAVGAPDPTALAHAIDAVHAALDARIAAAQPPGEPA